MTRLLFSRRQPHRRRLCHGRPRDVPDAVDVDGRDWALAVLQAVDRHLGDAVVVDEGAGHHEAVEYLMAVELKHAAAAVADIELRSVGRQAGRARALLIILSLHCNSFYSNPAKFSSAKSGIYKLKSQVRCKNNNHHWYGYFTILAKSIC